MEQKIKKQLGSGVMGTVYLSEVDGKPTVTKVERYDGDMTTKAAYVRQLIFNDQCAKYYPDRFMTLVSSGVIHNCEHKQKLPAFVKLAPKKIQDEHKKRALFEKCCVLSYTPVLKYTLRQVRNKLSESEKIATFKHLKKSVEIMHSYGFYHRDLHDGNIMCDESMKKWYIIDYGAIWHKSFIKSNVDKKIGDNFNDLQFLVWFFIENPVWDYLEEKKLFKKLPPYDDLLKFIRKDTRYKNFKKYINNKLPKGIQDDLTVQLCAILHYDLYIDGLGLQNLQVSRQNREFKQPNARYFLSVLRKL